VQGVKIFAGREYLSRRGERVLVTAIDAEGDFPVHFVVLTGRYKGVGERDGSRLTRDGKAGFSAGENAPEHWNDLVGECAPDE
jgi:hypothetical protein